MTNSWIKINFIDSFESISTNGKKIKQKDYLNEGEIPVIDQGKSLVGGFTNDKDKLIEVNDAVVIFGDHTKIIKLVNFDFAPGADGVKVIKPNAFYDPKLFAYLLQVLSMKIPDRGYSRHFQFLKKEKIPLLPIIEQKQVVKIVDELFSELDNAIENLKKSVGEIVDDSLSLAKTLRLSILKQAFEGKLTEEWRKEHPELITGENSAKALLKKIMSANEREQVSTL